MGNVTRVSHGWNEDPEDQSTMKVQTMPSSKRAASSADYQGGGVEYSQGPMGFKQTAHSAADMNDGDLIRIQGVEMSVKAAREYGLLDQQFPTPAGGYPEDEGLSSSAVARAAEEERRARAAEEVDQRQSDSDTGHPEFDASVDGLNEALEAGTIELSEAQAYETAGAELAMAKLSVEHAVQTLDGIEDGTVDPSAVPADVRSMLSTVERNVTAQATQSATSELGSDGFAELQRAAGFDPEVAEAIRGYAVRRATGRTEGATWGDLLADVREHLAGRG